MNAVSEHQVPLRRRRRPKHSAFESIDRSCGRKVNKENAAGVQSNNSVTAADNNCQKQAPLTGSCNASVHAASHVREKKQHINRSRLSTKADAVRLKPVVYPRKTRRGSDSLSARPAEQKSRVSHLPADAEDLPILYSRTSPTCALGDFAVQFAVNDVGVDVENTVVHSGHLPIN